MMEMPIFEKKEKEPKLLFKAILMRHEEPYYKDEGHDLTDNGVEGAIETGRRMKADGFFSDNDPVTLLHSPKPRAKGTLDFVAQGAEIPTEKEREIKMIGQSKMNNREAFMDRVRELDFDIEKLAEDHYKNDMYENRPDIIEPNNKKKERLYRSMEYLIRSIMKSDGNQNENGTPQILAVSHFEIITHLIDDVFGIENIGKYDSPSFGEQVKISAFETEDKNKISLDIEFRDMRKTVIFDRTSRSIEQINQ
ncbi:MAG: histidine phosphatase family protein [Candidatus Moranbacteria bacterium]|nr:histidine phosphatase family protein [Candidatus Moranbacteria bacterium]